MTSSESATTASSEMRWTSVILYIVSRTLTLIMTMKWKPCGGVASMKTSECSTQKHHFPTTTLNGKESMTPEIATGTERGNETTVRGSGDSVRGRENGRGSGCGAKRSGRGTV